MKKTIVSVFTRVSVVMLVLSLQSCATSRNITASDSVNTASERSLSYSSATTDRDSLSVLLEQMLASIEQRNIEIVHRNYDTAKPIDSTTGRPPLLAETLFTDKSKASHTKATNVVATNISLSDDTVALAIAVRDSLASSYKVDEHRSARPMWGWIVPILGGAAVLLLTVLFLRFKLANRT